MAGLLCIIILLENSFLYLEKKKLSKFQQVWSSQFIMPPMDTSSPTTVGKIAPTTSMIHTLRLEFSWLSPNEHHQIQSSYASENKTVLLKGQSFCACPFWHFTLVFLFLRLIIGFHCITLPLYPSSLILFWIVCALLVSGNSYWSLKQSLLLFLAYTHNYACSLFVFIHKSFEPSYNISNCRGRMI